MSITISGTVAEIPNINCLEKLGLIDLDSNSELKADTVWPEEMIGFWRRGLSTRSTEVTRSGNTIAVRILVLAAPEDSQLAYDLLRVLNVQGPIDAEELGEFKSLDELEPFLNKDSAYVRAESGARTLKALVESGRGPIGIPGAVRPLYVGERILGELEQLEGKLEINMLELLKKVQWEIDPKFEDAGVFQASPPRQSEDESESDEKWTIAIWLPDRNFIMPKVDRIAIHVGPDEVFMILAEHAAEVGGEHWNFIDECQATVDATTGEMWEQLVSRARAFRTE